jgi:hypothetical protein
MFLLIIATTCFVSVIGRLRWTHNVFMHAVFISTYLTEILNALKLKLKYLIP